MAQLGPLIITARNRDQAEYLVRSRAEQRGVAVESLDVTEAGTGMWSVMLTVTDAAKGLAAALTEDTQVFHLHARSHS